MTKGEFEDSRRRRCKLANGRAAPVRRAEKSREGDGDMELGDWIGRDSASSAQSSGAGGATTASVWVAATHRDRGGGVKQGCTCLQCACLQLLGTKLPANIEPPNSLPLQLLLYVDNLCSTSQIHHRLFLAMRKSDTESCFPQLVNGMCKVVDVAQRTPDDGVVASKNLTAAAAQITATVWERRITVNTSHARICVRPGHHSTRKYGIFAFSTNKAAFGSGVPHNPLPKVSKPYSLTFTFPSGP
ncbi:hypothetical protein B0H14DRAFT_2604220 [Mycena olivaceomarginata]|nr:hypothetical protein B0H14DRAFT_2604220 [Mycena olivaceomarginata]